jgi:hypothetical protein
MKKSKFFLRNFSLSKIMLVISIILLFMSFLPLNVNAKGLSDLDYICEYCEIVSIFVECNDTTCCNYTYPDFQIRVYRCYDCFNNSWLEYVNGCTYDFNCH